MSCLIKIATSDTASIAIANGVDFASLSIQLPSMDAAAVILPHAGRSVKVPGNTLEVTTLGVTFALSADLSNYIYFVNWIKNTLNDASDVKNLEILLYDADENVVRTVTVTDSFPISVSGLSYGNTDTNDVVFSIEFETNNVVIV